MEFLQGPNESIEAFNKRIVFLKTLKGASSPLFTPDFWLTRDESSEFNTPIINELFGISSTWVPLFISNKKLKPWQGACCFIFEMEENQQRGAFIQMRKKVPFFTSQDEILAHELVHAERLAFNEPIFEEIIASQVFSSPFRRYFTPLFQNSKESFLFACLTLLPPLLFPYLLFLSTRLFIRTRQFNKALSKSSLQKIVQMSDKEIIELSR